MKEYFALFYENTKFSRFGTTWESRIEYTNSERLPPNSKAPFIQGENNVVSTDFIKIRDFLENRAKEIILTRYSIIHCNNDYLLLDFKSLEREQEKINKFTVFIGIGIEKNILYYNKYNIAHYNAKLVKDKVQIKFTENNFDNVREQYNYLTNLAGFIDIYYQDNDLMHRTDKSLDKLILTESEYNELSAPEN